VLSNQVKYPQIHVLIINYEKVSLRAEPKELLLIQPSASESRVSRPRFRLLHPVAKVTSKRLAQATPAIDLIVCDEGHRLKSANTKTTRMFDALKTQRRISEYYRRLSIRSLLITRQSSRERRCRMTSASIGRW
jgi:hypothetical protein